MRSLGSQLALVLGSAAASGLFGFSSALAHTGDDARAGHVIGEISLWGVGVALAIGGLLFLFWMAGRVGTWLEDRSRDGKL